MDSCPLEAWMKKQKKDQNDLAELLGIPQSTFSAYIRGKRGLRLPRYYDLARATGLNVERLIAWAAYNQGANVNVRPSRRRTA